MLLGSLFKNSPYWKSVYFVFDHFLLWWVNLTKWLQDNNFKTPGVSIPERESRIKYDIQFRHSPPMISVSENLGIPSRMTRKTILSPRWQPACISRGIRCCWPHRAPDEKLIQLQTPARASLLNQFRNTCSSIFLTKSCRWSALEKRNPQQGPLFTTLSTALAW